MLTKIEAEKRAARLLLLLNGDGWKTRVWEDHGWHYKAYCAGLSVYVNADGYFAVLDKENKNSDCGEIFWTDRKPCGEPNEAVKRQLKKARQFVKMCDNAVLYHENRLRIAIDEKGLYKIFRQSCKNNNPFLTEDNIIALWKLSSNLK